MLKYVIAGGLENNPASWETSGEAWVNEKALWNFLKEEMTSLHSSDEIIINELDENIKTVWYSLVESPEEDYIAFIKETQE
jgi:hypothetical protein